MRPVERLESVTAYQLVRLGADGKFFLECNTSNITEPGDLGQGFYSDKKKIQYQQMILALKGIQTHIYEIEWVL